MQEQNGLPARQVQEPGGGRASAGWYDRAGPARQGSPAVPTRYAALTTVLRQRVVQHMARDQQTQAPLVGYICERCLDAPAVVIQPAPWGGEMGVCAACQQAPPAGDTPPQIEA